MTNTYLTGNPLGSTSPKDLYDNASNFDDVMNSTSPSFTDRRGNRRETWSGLQELVQSFLLSMGFVLTTPEVYQAGIQITARNQVFLKDGEYFKADGDLVLPYTTTGVWASESSNFVSVGDAVLRQALAMINGANLVGYDDSVLYDSGTVGSKIRSLFQQRTLESFGAVGDGVTDNTGAITDAIAYMASTGQNVIVGYGTFLCDPFIVNIESEALQASFVGIDRQRSILKRRVAGAGPFVQYGSALSTSRQSGCGFWNLTLDGGETTNGDTCVGYNLVRTLLDNVHFKGGNRGCHIYGGVSVTLRDCIESESRVGVQAEWFNSLAGVPWPNIIRIQGGEVVDCTDYGVLFDHGRMFILDSVEIEGNGTTLGAGQGGVYVGPNVGEEVISQDVASIGLIVTGACWFEANRGVADIFVDSGLTSINGGTFSSQATMVDNDIVINGGKYSIKNTNHSFPKTANILEGSGVFSGNIIENCEAAGIVFDSVKTSIVTGTHTILKGGRVPSLLGSTFPIIQTGADSTSANPTITFPVPFKAGTTPRIYLGVANNTPTTIDSPEYYATSNTGFTVRKKSFNGTVIGTVNYSITWIAVGEAD